MDCHSGICRLPFRARTRGIWNSEYPKISTIAIQYKQTMTEWMRDILTSLLPEQATARTASILMILLDGATIDARAFHDPAVATRAWMLRKFSLSRQTSTGVTKQRMGLLESKNPILVLLTQIAEWGFAIADGFPRRAMTSDHKALKPLDGPHVEMGGLDRTRSCNPPVRILV